jgi:NADH-quinone oxidoreductase subunit L
MVAGAPEAEAVMSTEYYLIGAAILIAVLGIVIAVVRLKPASLVPKARAPEEHGIERVLLNKYYVDEAYDATVVQPTVEISRGLLWRGIDRGIIDNVFVNGSAWLARGLAWIGGQLQTGQVGTYAWAIVIGVLLVLGSFTFR